MDLYKYILLLIAITDKGRIVEMMAGNVMWWLGFDWWGLDHFQIEKSTQKLKYKICNPFESIKFQIVPKKLFNQKVQDLMRTNSTAYTTFNISGSDKFSIIKNLYKKQFKYVKRQTSGWKGIFRFNTENFLRKQYFFLQFKLFMKILVVSYSYYSPCLF
jgi:hypothetical protein